MKNETKAKLSKLLQTVRLQPQNLQAQFLLGQTYLLNGDKQSARNQVRKSRVARFADGENTLRRDLRQFARRG